MSNNCCNPGDVKEEGQKADCARLLTKHLSLLVLTPSLNTHQLLLLVAFHTHTVSLGHYTRVGQSVRSEGTRNKTLLCICQAVPTALPSQPFSGHIRIGGGAPAWTGARHQRSCFMLSDISQKSGDRRRTMQKWNWGCHPGAVRRLVPMEHQPEIRLELLISAFLCPENVTPAQPCLFLFSVISRLRDTISK